MTIKKTWAKLAVEDLDTFERNYEKAENKEKAHKPLRKFRN